MTPLTEAAEKIKFESVAEEHAYPIVQSVAKQLGFKGYYQYEFYETADDSGYRKWVLRKYGGEYDEDLPDWILEHDCEEHQADWDDEGWGTCKICWHHEYEYQKYRVDYVLIHSKFEKMQWGIEIDSKKWHTDDVREVNRDSYLSEHGLMMIHLQAADVIWRPEDTKAYLIDLLLAKRQQDWTKRPVESGYHPADYRLPSYSDGLASFF